jgi:hypothetical protein
MARFISPSTLGCVILATVACASSLSEIRRPPAQSQELTVEVRNHNRSAITVYAYRSGFRDRIGFVEAADTQTFTFKWPADDLRFLIRFLAQGCLLTESMPVDAGDDLLLIVRVIDNEQASQVRCR